MIILDTEYTTWHGALERHWSGPNEHREIVQIAAIEIDEQCGEIASLEILVRPLLNPALSDLFVHLTGISQEQVDEIGVPFPNAYQRLVEFIGLKPVICMNMDGTVFLENCEIHTIPDTIGADFHRLRPFLDEKGIHTNVPSGYLHHLTPWPIVGGHTHNALHDVRSMAQFLRYNGGYKRGLQLPKGLPETDHRIHDIADI